MTSVTSLPRRAVDLVRTAGTPRLLLLGALALVAIGLLALATDHVRLAVAAVLLVQAALLALDLLGRRQVVASEESILRRIDQSDARVLLDVSRARQVLLDAADRERENGQR